MIHFQLIPRSRFQILNLLEPAKVDVFSRCNPYRKTSMKKVELKPAPTELFLNLKFKFRAKIFYGAIPTENFHSRIVLKKVELKPAPTELFLNLKFKFRAKIFWREIASPDFEFEFAISRQFFLAGNRGF